MVQQINITAQNTAKYSVEIDKGDGLEPIRFGFNGKRYWIGADIDHSNQVEIETVGLDLPIIGKRH